MSVFLAVMTGFLFVLLVDYAIGWFHERRLRKMRKLFGMGEDSRRHIAQQGRHRQWGGR